MILERLEKYKEALDVVRGKLGGNLFFNKSELCGEYSTSDLSTASKKKKF